MDITGGLKTEIFRPIIMLILPGLTIGTPLVFAVENYQPNIFAFFEKHPTLSSFIIFVLATILGVLASEIGSNIESHLIDKLLKKKHPNLEENWYKFLRCSFPDTSVAKNYIDNQVLYLKFELGMASALLLGWMFSLWAWLVREDFTKGWFITLSLCGIVGVAYFLFEAYQSGNLLARLRNELLKGVGVPPKCGAE